MKYRIRKITDGWGTFYFPQYKWPWWFWRFWLSLHEDALGQFKFKTQEKALDFIEEDKRYEREFDEGEKKMYEKMKFKENKVVWSE